MTKDAPKNHVISVIVVKMFQRRSVQNYFLRSFSISLLFCLLCSQGYCDDSPFYGRNITIEEAPFVAGILIARQEICTGTLVSDNIVLTSKNCLQSVRTIRDIKVFLGTNEIKEDSSNYHSASAIYTNLEGRKTGPKYLINVALIKLNDHVEISNTISPIRIEPKPWPSGSEKYFRQCSAMGFDKQYKPGATNKLHSSEVVGGFGPKACGCATLGRPQETKLICVRNLGSDRFCLGDTGGPLICDDTLVGLAHNTISCDNFPKNLTDLSECGLNSTVHTYVYLHNYLKWLNFVKKTKVMARSANNEMNINEISLPDDPSDIKIPSAGNIGKVGLTGLQLALIVIVRVLY